MGLFTPAWLKNDVEKGRKAVGKITDQSKLAEIARNAPMGDVRLAAIERITDERLLAAIAADTDRTELTRYDRERALEKIGDDALLSDVLLAGKVGRKAAEETVARMQSQEALYRLAEKSVDFRAFDRITDETKRYELCLKHNSYVEFSHLETNRELWVQLGQNGAFPATKTVDYCRALIEAGDLRGVDILVRFMQTSDHNHYLNEAAALLKSLYRSAGDGGDAALEARVLALPRGFYGPHTDNHYEDCGYGSHNDSPRAHFDIP